MFCACLVLRSSFVPEPAVLCRSRWWKRFRFQWFRSIKTIRSRNEISRWNIYCKYQSLWETLYSRWQMLLDWSQIFIYVYDTHEDFLISGYGCFREEWTPFEAAISVSVTHLVTWQRSLPLSPKSGEEIITARRFSEILLPRPEGVQGLNTTPYKLLFKAFFSESWELWAIIWPAALCGKEILVLHSPLGKAAGWLRSSLWARSAALIQVAASGDYSTHCVQRFSATVHPHLPGCRSCISCRVDVGWRFFYILGEAAQIQHVPWQDQGVVDSTFSFKSRQFCSLFVSSCLQIFPHPLLLSGLVTALLAVPTETAPGRESKEFVHQPSGLLSWLWWAEIKAAPLL